MNNFIIMLHKFDSNKLIWINPSFIISVIDERPLHDWTDVCTFAGGPLYYRVKESPEKIIEIINEANAHLNYTVPDPVYLQKE